MVGFNRGAQHCLWQHPFVDVFKTFDVAKAEQRGDVSDEMDRTICKRVHRICGTISANNYILLPNPRAKKETKTLGLTGEFIYLQLKPFGLRFFLVHLDFTVAAMNVLRLTLSNMYSEMKTTSHSVQCPCHLTPSWSVVCVHVPSVLALCTRVVPHAFTLRSVQFCASLHVRNMFTSDIRYEPDSLPREMLFDHQGRFEERYAWVDIPGAEAPPTEPSSIVNIKPNDGVSCVGGAGSVSTQPAWLPGWPVVPDPPAPQGFPWGGGWQATAPLPTKDPAVVQSSATSTAHWGSVISEVTLPDPMLEVSHLIGVSRKSRHLNDLDGPIPRRSAVYMRFSSGETGDTSLRTCVLYASSMTLALVDSRTNIRRFFFGHSRPIELLEASDDGMWCLSGQGSEGGAPPLLRLWRVDGSDALRCMSVVSCPSLSSIRAASFDPLAKFIALVGTDLQGRQQLTIWDMSRLLGGGNVSLFARQTSADWDMDCVKFSPFEELHVVTCGRENIRFWRTKDGHLPGCNVTLDALARQSHFTGIAFEFNKMGQPFFLGEHLAVRHRVFVSTSLGKVLQLSYRDRKVQAVYQLHNSAITSLCANDGFVVTASADRYVRIWPLDFKSFYLHAMHDAPVIGVDISVDGLKVVCSTSDGSVGVLNMQSHDYEDLVRSHGAPIADVAFSRLFLELATVSDDGTLKVWSLATMTQTHEFSIEDDKPMCLEFHPGPRHLVAVGFKSGTLRLFDVDGPSVLHEFRHHVRPILSLAFHARAPAVPSCRVEAPVSSPAVDTSEEPPALMDIVTCDASGALVFYDESCDFQVVRCPEQSLCTLPPDRCPAMVCAPLRLLQYLDARCLALMSLPSLEMKQKLRVTASTICTFAFSFDACFVVVGSADSKIHVFDAASGEATAAYSFASGAFSAAAFTTFSLGAPFRDTALLFAATADSLLRLVELHAASPAAAPDSSIEGISCPRLPVFPQSMPTEQCFIGHATAPSKVLLAPGILISISASEIITWTDRGSYLERLYTNEPATSEEVAEAPGEPLEELIKSVSPRASTPPREKGPVKPRLIPRLPPMKLQHLSGGAVTHSAQAFAYGSRRAFAANDDANLGSSGPAADSSAAAGVLCHTAGSVVLVEPFGSEEIGEGCARSDADTVFLAKLPGSEALVLDILLDDKVPSKLDLIAVISVERTYAVQPPAKELVLLQDSISKDRTIAWLSLHLLTSLRECAKIELPHAYAGPFPRLTAIDAPMCGSSEDICESVLPHVRISRYGQRIVTATALFVSSPGGARGRVDVWGYGDIGENCLFSTLSSAELASSPIDLLLPNSLVGEFLVLCSRTVVFWRLEEGLEEEPPPSSPRSCWLQYQLAETPPEMTEDADLFSSFATMPVEAWQLMLVGTLKGRLWAYNLDDNQIISDVQLADGEAVDSLTSVRWPHLISGISSSLSSFALSWDSCGRLQAAKLNSLRLDGRVLAIQLGPHPEEGVASTTANTIWYFHMVEGLCVRLQAFHAVSSRMLRSNIGLLPTENCRSVEQSKLASVPVVAASCDDDGKVRLWSCRSSDDDESMCCPQAVAEFVGSRSACTAVCFLRSSLLACAFLDGSVCIFGLDTFCLLARIEVDSGDPLTALERLSSNSLIVGTNAGRIVEMRLQIETSDDSGKDIAVAEARQLALQVPTPLGKAVCSLCVDLEEQPSRFLCCFASLELWVWGHEGRAEKRPELLHTWVWPESRPDTLPSGHCGDHKSCLDMLAGPPMVATFVPRAVFDDKLGPSLVVVGAPPELTYYVYDCDRGAVVNRIVSSKQLPNVVRLRALPTPEERWLPTAFPGEDTDVPRVVGGGVIVALTAGGLFARLQLMDGGRHSQWLDDRPCELPGYACSLGPCDTVRGTPDFCVISRQLSPGLCQVLLKGDAALSSWTLGP